jgi:hypothetical protein
VTSDFEDPRFMNSNQKYRPFTPEEAVKHIGRVVSSAASRSLGIKHRIAAVGQDGVIYSWNEVHSIFGGYTGWDSLECLARDYRFVDDRTPCGVPIEGK